MALDDKAHVGHRHTTSDIRGGRFPEGMLPSTIIPSIEAAQATAASKSKVVFSANAASGTNFSEGDTWYQRVAGIIIAQWEFTSGAWATRTLDSAVIANLDASKITTGTLAAGQKITAGDPGGSRVELDSAGLRKYAADGTTVQVDLTGDVAAFSGLITGSEIIAGTAGAARVELDAAGLRVYAADGTTVLLDTADAVMVRARGGNTALGHDVQTALTTGEYNTALGADAQTALTTGDYNTAVGAWAQRVLTTGVYNAAVGGAAQFSLTSGYHNTAVGINAQMYLTTGHDNAAVGGGAQATPLGTSVNKTITASYQTSIGPETGQSSAAQVDGITTIGYRATAGAANATSIGREARADHAGSIALGYQALTTQTDQVMVGPRDVEITDTTKGLVLVSPDGTRMRITSADGGGLLVNGTAIGGGGGGTPASETVAGIVELATSAEAVAGTDTVRAVTPAGVKAVVADAGGGVYAIGASSVGPLSALTTLVDAPAITADGVKKYKVTLSFRVAVASVATDVFYVVLTEVNAGTAISNDLAIYFGHGGGGLYTAAFSFAVPITPTAGSRVYRLSAVRAAGTGTATFYDPKIIVEQIR